MRIRDIKYKIQYKIQRAKKGYSDNDLFSIYNWFIDLFPRMLDEFAECTCGCPCNEEELKEDVSKMPKAWVESQRAKVNQILGQYDLEFDLNNSMCCWILIILRMKRCFEMCDEWNQGYEKHWQRGFYEILNAQVEKNKKEAFYLFEKYFFNLWW